jgi:hypothetical protein
MIRILTRWAMAALLLAGALAVAGAAPASAHERRTVGGFQFAVGWGDEPSYSGFKNSVQVTITEANGGAAVTDVGDSLKVEVSKGSEKASLPLVANFRVGAFGTPGDYRAWLTPTRPGGYTFRFTGSIRGQNVDESFASSKTTFNDVEDVATIQFPAKDPSTGELGTRIDREVPRLETGLREAQDRAESAKTLARLGVGVGAIALLAAAGVLVVSLRSRRRGHGAGHSETPVSEMARPNA